MPDAPRILSILHDCFHRAAPSDDAQTRIGICLDVLVHSGLAGECAVWEREENGTKHLCRAALNGAGARVESGNRTGDAALPVPPAILPFRTAESLLPPSPSGDRAVLLSLGDNGRLLCLTLPDHVAGAEETALSNLALMAAILGLWIDTADHAEERLDRLMAENEVLRGRLGAEHGFPKVIGNCQAMRDIYAQVAQVATAETSVLLRGESGTGKELIAEAIHQQSPRRNHPFVRVNCAAIPDTLIESEFFGHERGAFTGAVARKRGRFEMADGGTLFLDEIGELSPATQAKLLRVLQEQTFERVGGTEAIRVNVRLIAATNADLETRMGQGGFREDLYYRLNVFPIYLPSLRERKTDILLLADHFLHKYARKQGKSVQRISTPAIDALMRYHWPGNVRELENVMERAVLVSQDQVIHAYHLPPSLQTPESSGTLPRIAFTDSVALHEKELLVEALKAARGNRARAARLLQITERIMGYKIQKYGIDPTRYKV